MAVSGPAMAQGSAAKLVEKKAAPAAAAPAAKPAAKAVSGYEYRFGTLELRGGAGYTREMWNPAGGVGFNISERFGLDVAVYGNAANVERKRHAAIAASLRFNR